MKGYRALRESAAWLDLSGRGKIRVTGEDRARLLHAMTTNHVQGMKSGDSCYAFFLNAQGRILADVSILCQDDSFLLDTEPETARKVYEHLDKFIIADDVVLEDLTDGWATVAVHGTGVLNGPDSVLWAPLSYTGRDGWFVFCEAADKAALIAAVEAAGAVEADLEAATVIRIENGRPRYGDDISERFLAQETSQTRALHFSKGCYLGQEIVERVRSRAQIHRRLMPVHLDTPAPPAPGAKLQAGGKDAAEITSAAFSPALGKTVALAYVRIDVKPGDAVSFGEVQGVVQPSPAG